MAVVMQNRVHPILHGIQSHQNSSLTRFLEPTKKQHPILQVTGPGTGLMLVEMSLPDLRSKVPE